MVNVKLSASVNPHDRDETLDLSQSLKLAQSSRELTPVLQWMVDNGKLSLREVLNRVLNLTQVRSELAVGATSQAIGAELMRVLHSYTGTSPVPEVKPVAPEVLSVYEDGTLLLRLGSGRTVTAFALEPYTKIHGLDPVALREGLIQRKVRPLMGSVYPLHALKNISGRLSRLE